MELFAEVAYAAAHALHNFYLCDPRLPRGKVEARHPLELMRLAEVVLALEGIFGLRSFTDFRATPKEVQHVMRRTLQHCSRLEKSNFPISDAASDFEIFAHAREKYEWCIDRASRLGSIRAAPENSRSNLMRFCRALEIAAEDAVRDRSSYRSYWEINGYLDERQLAYAEMPQAA
jgi:hypothetical protein